jgi:hypothetical protein
MKVQAEEEADAVVKIQKAYRGHDARNRLNARFAFAAISDAIEREIQRDAPSYRVHCLPDGLIVDTLAGGSLFQQSTGSKEGRSSPQRKSAVVHKQTIASRDLDDNWAKISPTVVGVDKQGPGSQEPQKHTQSNADDMSQHYHLQEEKAWLENAIVERIRYLTSQSQ